LEFIKYVWFAYLVNIIDILVVAYILFRLLQLIKGTRAVQIILGILTLVALTFIAREVLFLRTLSWMLDKFWLAAVVILAVAFQPEIRSALAQLGSHRWGRILVSSELGFIDEIVEAAVKCRKLNIGALIVLEQETGLRSYVESGTILNAQVSWELLVSIFNNKSPMHDGAVIIKNARITAAGCVLPISHEQGISKILGTRHRAALGLSEISDAMIIVVSEESGDISLASDGRLETGVEPEDLKKRLWLSQKRHAESILKKKSAG